MFEFIHGLLFSCVQKRSHLAQAGHKLVPLILLGGIFLITRITSDFSIFHIDYLGIGGGVDEFMMNVVCPFTRKMVNLSCRKQKVHVTYMLTLR